MSVIRHNALPQSVLSHVEPASIATVGANGLPLDVAGQVTVLVSLGNYCVQHTFLVVHGLTVEGLLGADFLDKHKAVVDFVHHRLTLGSNGDNIPVQDPGQEAGKVLTVAMDSTTEVPGRSVLLVTGCLEGPCATSGGLIEPNSERGTPKHIMLGRCLSTVHGGKVTMEVTNTSPGPITLFQGTRVACYTPLDAIHVVDTAQPTLLQPTSSPADVDVDLSQSPLSIHQKDKLKALLTRFRHVFSCAGEPLGRTTVVKHDIEVTGFPIRQRTRRLPVALKEVVHQEVQGMLSSGVIRPSSSPWNSPLVLIKKKDGTWRFCIDLRKVNAITHRDAYPLPRIDETLDSLAHASVFTTLDLASGYWQVELEESAKEKTAFSTPGGHYEFNVMPFGLTNAPATFQRLMECVLAGLTPTQCLSYLDDIIVFATTFDDHLSHLEHVLTKLGEAGLRLKPSKCHFALPQVQYLGYLISKDGVQPDPSKVEAVTSYPTPSNATEVREFLGIANYYRRFVEGFSAIATPLYQLTRKTANGFLWTPECQKAFDQLKQKLVSPPILAYPQFDVPFVVQTDASAHAVGGVLSQVQDGKERVIAYWSQQLKKAERNYSTIEREALAVVGAIKEFYPYRYGFPFQLHTDHNPLVSLKTVKDFGGRVSRWMLLLQQFDFTVVYKPGTSNGNADCLSRPNSESP